MARLHQLSACARSFGGVGGSAINSSSPGVVTAFGFSTGAASGIATLYDSAGSTTAGLEMWTLIASPVSHVHVSFPWPIPFGASGLYLGILGSGCAMVAWEK